MPLLEKYTTSGAHTFDGREPTRCPICRFPQRNGFQLTCEPGICMYRETPLHYRCDEVPAIASLVLASRLNPIVVTTTP